MGSEPWDGAQHLRAELARLAAALRALVHAPRQAGDSGAPGAFAGLVIEEGEVDQLLAELTQDRSSRASVGELGEMRHAVAERARAAAGLGASLPLLQTARAFRLDPMEYDALLLAFAVEVDARFGRVVAYLNDHAARTRPTLGLLAALARLESAESMSFLPMLERPAVRDSLLLLEGDGPLSSQSVRISTDIVAFLAQGGERKARSSSVVVRVAHPNAMQRLVLDADAERRARAFALSLADSANHAFVLLIGTAGSGRATLARAIASEAGLPLVRADLAPSNWAETLREARRERRYAGESLLLLRADAPLPWDDVWSALADVDGPLGFAVPATAVDAVLSRAPRTPALLPMTELGVEARVKLWETLLPSQTDVRDLTAIVTRFPFNPRGVARSIARATANLSLQPAEQRHLDDDDLARACRQVGEAAMGPSAQKLPLPFTRDDLVVTPRVRAELDLALAWVQQQHRVFDTWDFGARVVLGRGLTALFAGLPGTGKTMAAQVLARELRVDAYRVDLSRVMSKYIGETEKNLASLFDEARSCGAILFFDEADALFGKRSEVSDAHDRYANVEVAFLLQRMEEHPGVTVLATNRLRDLDEAFLRRFHFIVDFPAPEPAERLKLWQGMLPEACERDADLDFDALAREFEMTGGEIKNAALAAAFGAASEGRAVGMRHLVAAVRRELAKGGRVLGVG